MEIAVSGPFVNAELHFLNLPFHPNSSVQEISSRLPDVDFTRLQDLVRKMASALTFFLKIVVENRKEY